MRADRESRSLRDGLVLRLFLGGVSFWEIGRHPQVRLSHEAVGNIVK